jgi:hypothetical protein
MAQFSRTFPKIGIPTHPPTALMEYKSIVIFKEVRLGLFKPQGKTGGVKLCR